MTCQSKTVTTIAFLSLFAMAMFQGSGTRQTKEAVDYVNPYVGSISPKTGGTSPTVLVPHGTMAVAPQFTPGIGDKYLADRIFGFSAGPVTIIQSATLNGQPLNKPWFSHTDLVRGGSLILLMGPRPNEKWGSSPEAAPPSMSPATRGEVRPGVQGRDREGAGRSGD